MAVIADLVTMILLSVFVSLSSEGGGQMWLLLILFATGVVFYFIGVRFKSRNFVARLSTGTVQIGTRAIFTLIIVLVALSESVGAENILGAFIAGTLVSLLNPDQGMIRQLDSFGYGFLIPIFFVMVGVDLDLWSLADSAFDIQEVTVYDEEILEKEGVFEADILFIATGDEELNSTIAIAAKEREVERVIARIDSPDLAKLLTEQDIEVFSTLLATTALMKALIESPNIANIMTSEETALHEIRMMNPEYDQMTLLEFPFIGDVIIVRIFRGKDSIVPHGDTELPINDRLIVTGSMEYVEELTRELQYKY